MEEQPEEQRKEDEGEEAQNGEKEGEEFEEDEPPFYEDERGDLWHGFQFPAEKHNSEPPERDVYCKEWSAKCWGETNPHDFTSKEFWKFMIYSGWNAYRAKNLYFQKAKEADGHQSLQDEDVSDEVDNLSSAYPTEAPVWCYSRFGQSLTLLPDGRRVFIAGEHEDYYDPDFFIYNDVVIVDAQGSVERIWGYPKEVFPPTDFHTAVLVSTKNEIWIIGSVGYSGERTPGFTPVYRLSLYNWTISKVDTKGDAPGWISKAKGTFDSTTGCITLKEGSAFESDGFVKNTETFILDTTTLLWRKAS